MPQDRTSDCLLGRILLRQALQQHLDKELGASSASLLALPPDVSQPAPFECEVGFAELALLLLSRSSLARQRELAGALVAQLARLAEALSRPSQPGGAAAAATAAAASGAEGDGGGAAEVPQPGIQHAAAAGSTDLDAVMAVKSPGESEEGVGAADGADGVAGSSQPGAAPAGGSGKLRRAFGAFGSRNRQRASSHAADAPATAPLAPAGVCGEAAALQVSAWLRLMLLSPLLPTVRADREPDARKNLRPRCAATLAQLLAAQQLDVSSSEGAAEASGEARAGAAAAAVLASQPLVGVLASVLAALASGSWAGWLSGGNMRLREVPALQTSEQLAAEAIAKQLPPRTLATILAALPLRLQPENRLEGAAALAVGVAAAASDADDAPAAQPPVLTRLPVWLPVEAAGDVSRSDGQAGPLPAVPLLAGYVRRMPQWRLPPWHSGRGAPRPESASWAL